MKYIMENINIALQVNSHITAPTLTTSSPTLPFTTTTTCPPAPQQKYFSQKPHHISWDYLINVHLPPEEKAWWSDIEYILVIISRIRVRRVISRRNDECVCIFVGDRVGKWYSVNSNL